MNIQDYIFNGHIIAFEWFEQEITGLKPTGKWPLPTCASLWKEV